jgi:hypothetical protein
LPWIIETTMDEAQEMTRTLQELEPPRARDDLELVRDGREGTYWQAADGLIVRVAAAESAHDEEAAQRALLALACRDAAEQ